MKGQVNLFNIFRTECLIKKLTPCNIFYAAEVARYCGVDCQGGCCYSCKLMNECGACCNNAKEMKYKK